jgi:2-polyprenyl-3-methyl-5-hydroxy-6-metoxy-1,4-benzoquinol methylase
MKRIPEPELMDDPEQARAYALADFAEPHQSFVDHFVRCFPRHRPQRVLDLGCGAADISIRFARTHPDCEITGVDGAEAMLVFAREAIAAAGITARVRLRCMHLPAALTGAGTFDTVISNSLLHHLADPAVLWQTLAQLPAARTAVFVMDLMRPPSEQMARELVQQYADQEPEILKRDFYHSLCAAYRPDEIEVQLRASDLAHLQIEVVSDRHLIVWGELAP